MIADEVDWRFRLEPRVPPGEEHSDLDVRTKHDGLSPRTDDRTSTTRSARVRIRLLATADGGRSTALGSGYRSLLRMVDSDQLYGFELDLDPPRFLAPGGTGTGSIVLLFNTGLDLATGRRFEIQEGLRTVGDGEITV